MLHASSVRSSVLPDKIAIGNMAESSSFASENEEISGTDSSDNSEMSNEADERNEELVIQPYMAQNEYCR